jgi:hypothetical protein
MVAIGNFDFRMRGYRVNPPIFCSGKLKRQSPQNLEFSSSLITIHTIEWCKSLIESTQQLHTFFSKANFKSHKDTVTYILSLFQNQNHFLLLQSVYSQKRSKTCCNNKRLLLYQPVTIILVLPTFSFEGYTI